MTTSNAIKREEIEQLLPWHAAGTLSRRDAQRVEQALQNDADLARQFALVREEFSETLHLNETLGAPSARAMDRLLAGIEAESGPAKQAKPSFSFSTWLAERLSEFAPRKLAYAATAAVALIAIQAGLLGGMFVADRDDGFRSVGAPTATYDTASRPSMPGSFAKVDFAPTATVADITKFLDVNQLAVVDGPRKDGSYRVRVTPVAVPKEELAQIMTRLGREAAIVRTIASE